jgi:CRISPR/Cas system-associated endonuclease Cas1
LRQAQLKAQQEEALKQQKLLETQRAIQQQALLQQQMILEEQRRQKQEEGSSFIYQFLDRFYSNANPHPTFVLVKSRASRNRKTQTKSHSATKGQRSSYCTTS